MKTYIAMLRGINVSGRKSIRMADLKSHLEALGWEDVRTYVQSGNLIFKTTETDPGHLATLIQQKLQVEYGFEVPTMVIEPGDLRQIINKNPFPRDPATVRDRLYVTFLFDTPREELISMITKPAQIDEHFILGGNIIYLYYPGGYGRARMDNNAFEKALQVKATTRNWKTVNKLLEMAG
jgi:uncharacterized protein (DUF1697 family)